MSSSALAVVLLMTAVLAAAAGFAVGRLWHPTPSGQPGVETALTALQTQLVAAEREQAASEAAMARELALMRESSERLRAETSSLSTALRSPATRGRWGETQLRRVLELGGAIEHCDFETQHVLPDKGRPDVVVRLAGDRCLVVDAKAPLEAFLAATEAVDDAERLQLHKEHARQVRAHVRQLADRSYWSSLPTSPELVVLFLPGDAFLEAALRAEPTLQETAFASNVVLATPSTLLALIRTVAFGWRQERVTANAREIARLGGELHERLGAAAAHLAKLGSSLRGSVDAYNATLGSLEARVLPAARRLSAHVDDGVVRPLPAVDVVPRSMQAEELTRSIGPPEAAA